MDEVNQVIEQLRYCNEEVPTALRLPNEDELVVIEEELLISLPYPLREFLLTVSDVVYGALEPVTVTDPNSHTYLPEVAATAWSVGMPRHLIPLSEVKGDYYCVDLEGRVLFWSHDGLADEQWDSIWQWAKEVWLGIAA